MKFTLIASPGSAHQCEHQDALRHGLSAHGIESISSPRGFSSTKYVACWGWRKGKELRSRGHEVLVIERGYLGDRFSWTSLAWNGLNGKAEFPSPIDDGGERFRKHFQLMPWKDGGEYILIMGQVPGDASLEGKNMLPWYELIAAEAKEKYGLPVKFRPHPMAIRRGMYQSPRGVEVSVKSLEDDLSRAALVITYNSNSAVDAVVSGVPALSFDRGSMAYPVTGHSIGELVKPSREQWAYKLAWMQWSLSEIRSGAALVGLLDIAYGR